MSSGITTIKLNGSTDSNNPSLDQIGGYKRVAWFNDPSKTANLLFTKADDPSMFINFATFFNTTTGAVRAETHDSSITASGTLAAGDLAGHEVNVEFLTRAPASLGGRPQVDTATVAGTIGSTGGGNATVIVTAAGMAGSPITVSVAVANSDTATMVAVKVRAALAANATIAAFFTIGGTGTTVVLTRTVSAAYDSSINIDVDNGTCTGLTDAPTSVHTTAGMVSALIFTSPTEPGFFINLPGLFNLSDGTLAGHLLLGETGLLKGDIDRENDPYTTVEFVSSSVYSQLLLMVEGSPNVLLINLAALLSGAQVASDTHTH
jgi:hypothetical protein